MAGDATENVFNVIDAFTVPRLAYSVDRKKFLPDPMPAKVFAGNASFLPNVANTGTLDVIQKKADERLDQCTGLLVRHILSY